MRRAGALALTILLLLTACRGGKATESEGPAEEGGRPDPGTVTYPCTIPESASSHSITLSGGLKVEAVSEGYWQNAFARDLTLNVFRGEECLQTILAATGVWPEDFQLLAVDADFDGDADVCFTYSEGAKSRFYAFYLWDEESGRLTADPYGLNDVSNPTFDADRGVVTGEAGDDVSGETTFYRYEDGALTFVRSLSYNSSVTPKMMWVTEVTQGDRWEPLRIVREGEFTSEDWDDLNLWRDLSYFGEG